MIAGDLLETIVGRLDPPFRLAKFEGDAGFLFVEDGRAAGSLLVDAIEACYLAFRRRLRSIDAATSCDCASCRLAPRLDLKVFVHHGSYVHSRIAGRDELAGSDVILAHRLLKGDRRGARRGRRPASPCSPTAAIERARARPRGPGMTDGEESIEHLGRVSTFVWDLEARWQAESGRAPPGCPSGEVVLDIDVALRPPSRRVWAHLTTPALRSRWEGRIVIEESSVGGAAWRRDHRQCVTGRLATIEEVVDWQPYEHIGWRLTVPESGRSRRRSTWTKSRGARGSHLRCDGRPTGPPRPATAIDRLREKRAALERLARVLDAGTGTTEAQEAPT